MPFLSPGFCGALAGRFLDDQVEDDGAPANAVQTSPASIGGYPWPGRYVGALWGTWTAEEVAQIWRVADEDVGDDGPQDEWDSTVGIDPDDVGASVVWAEIGQPGDVEEVTDALTVERVIGVGPDVLGSGLATAPAITVGTELTVVWVGVVTSTAPSSLGFLAGAFQQVTESDRRAGGVAVSPTGQARAIFASGGAASTTADVAVSGLTDGETMCVLVGTYRTTGSPVVELTAGVAGGTPASASTALSGSPATTGAVPCAWTRAGVTVGGSPVGSYATGRGEWVVLNRFTAQAAREAIVAGGRDAVLALFGDPDDLGHYAASDTLEDGDELADGGELDGATWSETGGTFAGGLNVPVAA